MRSDLHITQIPAIFHCQISACSSQQLGKDLCDCILTETPQKMRFEVILGTVSHVAFPWKGLLIRPCKISIRMKAGVSIMRPRGEAG